MKRLSWKDAFIVKNTIRAFNHLEELYICKSSLPFEINKSESFFDVLGDWIGDVFYDTLPESGFELRDEQIYMAFQLEKAFKEKKVCLQRLVWEQEKRLFIFYMPFVMRVIPIALRSLHVLMRR